MVRFGNQDATVHFDDAARLLQHDLDMPRIFAPLLRETVRQRRGRNILEDDKMAFGFGDHLLCDHQNISHLECE